MSKFASAVLTGAAMSLVLPASVQAQDAALTQGGDVTAEDVTPLPPVIVESPAEPPRRKRGKTASAAAPGTEATEGTAVDSALPGVPGVGIYTLGEQAMVGGSVITNGAMWTFNKTTLDQALSIVPGVTMHNTGGSRNERNLYVRGFDRYRVPLSIDGVRIYLPADNRLDFNRFLTPDLSEIQIQKGYVSVLNGPGGMGGAINMVSRKPTKAIEAEGRVGTTFDGDLDSLGAWNAYAYAGTRQKGYYAQLSGNIVDQDHWSLPDSFTPSLLTNEDGGDRDHSNIKDWRINAKVGVTPNATDEYSINYTVQSGEKSAPLHVRGQAVQGRYWTWPYWDISTLSWLSKTQIGSASYVKTNVYYNTFDNLLSSYDNATYTTQSAGRSFESWYEDNAYGGSIEAGTDLIPMNTLKAAVHYRRDNHTEFQISSPDLPTSTVEPEQHNKEDTWSIALENTFHATRRLDFIGGISYDKLAVRQAQDYDSTLGLYENPVTTSDAYNYQGGAIYSLSETGKVHATVSSRTRFPTIFERYSTRFGLSVPNPDLGPERSTNYEIGWSDMLTPAVRVSATAFYSKLKNSIQSVYVSTRQTQNQNIDGEHYGIELTADWTVMRGLRVGGNYTYLERELDFETAGTRAEGTPQHEAFLYLAWDATNRFTITPSLQLASEVYSLKTSDTSLTYIKTGSYALLNVQADYDVSETVTIAAGATNLFDEYYELTEGFPEAGRQFYLTARARY